MVNYDSNRNCKSHALFVDLQESLPGSGATQNRGGKLSAVGQQRAPSQSSTPKPIALTLGKFPHSRGKSVLTLLLSSIPKDIQNITA